MAKKQIRRIRRTKLMVGEGRADKTWFQILKVFYSSGLCNITLDKATGGSPYDIVLVAVKKNQISPFSEVMVVLDGDKSKKEIDDALRLAKAHSIQVVIVRPCMEAVLLNILEPEGKWNKKSTPTNKHHFESNYIEEKRRTQLIAYSKVFKKKMIDEALKKKTNKELIMIVRYLIDG